MCWSPTADLVAGGAIVALGIVSVGRVVRKHRIRDLPLAALPLVLGVHQLIESVVWSQWDDGTGGQIVGGWAVTAWALIAFPLLPAYIPLAVSAAARWGRRVLLLPFALLGLATSAVMAYALASGPITAAAVGHTMRYGIHDLPANWLVIAGYLVATIGALLLSTDADIRLLGLVGGVGALVCWLLWRFAFASTWCALAAVASLVLLRWSWSGRRKSTLMASAARQHVR